jgi:hypothetical protein
MQNTMTTEDERTCRTGDLYPISAHDGVTEWSDCGSCGARIDWAAITVESTDTCPYCGSLQLGLAI